ncbi:lipid II:glycine glycyltransferase FemX [Bifidobacterium cebidarum]|uniref:Peptidoglycan bridge formation protein FemAB n=1 Tax=Bifidobacterium cebidarum TaxID=2650773 RepID=A0A6I1G8K0_9BIFI|nr:GNAT family N-acetyltransferase [Bifidobacterium cebidarum]KAB7787879.1 peptidoglycan bridge formation protein FemAB [Bifidobacterium cebidarum]
MITLKKVDGATLEAEAAQAGITLPIEQTAVWSNYQSDIDGRTPWGSYLIIHDDAVVAVISFIDYETHGYHYLRSVHGPTWLTKPNESDEQQVIAAIVDMVRHTDRNIVFIRIDTWYSTGTKPVLSTVPYDATVVIDVTGGDDAILSRMKRRGRRDVRKSLRECPAEVADETQQALNDFSEYYDVMVETGKRDGFAPAPISDYSDMIKALGANHCRVFAARIDDKVVAWSIVTVNGSRAVRYYAGMRNEVMRLHVTDKLLYSECCILGTQGITDYDLMGIGSDFAPSLKGLNEFKTKFTEEITPVAPARDIPVKKSFYWALQTLQHLRKSIRK